MKQAVVVILYQSGRFLYVERGPAVPMAGHWAPPSGSIEPGETHEEAVVREMGEELDIEVAPVRKVWECPSHDGAYLLHWWQAEITGGEPRPDGREVSRAEWLTAEEIAAKEPIFTDDLRFFREVWPGLTTSNDAC